MKGQTILFYDGTCGMCHRIVRFLIHYDHKKVFLFAPLQGETAARLLPHFKEMDTLVLLESERIFIYGKGALRTLWLLGGIWVIPGLLSFLPSFLYDWIYRWVARHRFRWFGHESCLVPKKGDLNRFLP